MKNKQKEIKNVPLRMPREIWIFLKNKSITREMSMNDIVLELLLKYKKKCENKLTEDDLVIS